MLIKKCPWTCYAPQVSLETATLLAIGVLFLQICVILMSSATVPWYDGTLPFVYGNSPGHG